MSSRGDGYRLKADEADEWARNTADESVRAQFENLARHFRDLAKTIEGPGLVIDFSVVPKRH